MQSSTPTASPVPVPVGATGPVYTSYAAPQYDARLGDAWDRRRTFGNVYSQPIWPFGGVGGATAVDARIGDFYDRRRCFGNIFTQPLYPWSGQPASVRLGDAWDRRITFGNIYRQPIVPAAGPVGPALGFHYADSAYRVGAAAPPTTTAPPPPGFKAQDNVYPFA